MGRLPLNRAHRSDPELVHACLAGDQQAWHTLVDRYGRLVYSIPHRYGMEEADADDVFAAVWETAFRKLEGLRDLTRLSAWLITTTHRECWRIGKSRKTAGAYAEFDQHFPDVSTPHEQRIEQWEQQHLVRQALDELGGRCRDLLTALFLEPAQSSYEAIAERLGMTLGSIGPTRARCFKKLQQILERMGIDA